MAAQTPDVNNSEPDKETIRPELSPPNFDKEGKPQNKAIQNAKQAHAIAQALKNNAIQLDGRLDVAATIASLYNGAAPFDQKKLDESGQDWRANCSTGFLPSIVDRVTPQMRDPILRADVLTHSTLPAEIPEGAAKSQKFCEETTATVRKWKGWNDHVSLMTQDVALYGYASPGHISRDWRPRLFRPDQCFLFDGAEQHASRQQVIVFWQPMMIHDYMDLWQDEDARAMGKYNLEGCIAAGNESGTMSVNDPKKTPLQYEDAIREKGKLAYSVENQARTVNLFHVFVREYTGEVALWTVSEEGGHEIRHLEDASEIGCECMEDVVTLYTLQVGNGRYYGSKGLGRLLANVHLCVERGRCLGIDQVYLAGLVILFAKTGDIKNLKPSVQHPFIIIQGEATIGEQQISFNATDWKLIDDMLTAIAENTAGAFIPPNMDQEGSPNTKIEAAQDAEHKMALRQGFLGRFFSQFADHMGAIQRRMYSVENMKEGYRLWKDRKLKKSKGIMLLAKKLWARIKEILGGDLDQKLFAEAKESAIADPDAVETIVRLLDAGLTVQEIQMLALAPTGDEVQSNNAQHDQATLAFFAQNAQNPYYDKSKMSKIAARLAIGEDRANEIVLPAQFDPDDVAIQSRWQLLEFMIMVGGTNAPVAATDKHAIHRQVLAPRMGQVLDMIEKAVKVNAPIDQNMVNMGAMIVDHYAEHLNQDMESTPENKQKEYGVLKTYEKIIQDGERLVANQAKQREKEAALAASAQQNGGIAVQPNQPVPSGAPAGNDVDATSKVVGDAVKVAGHGLNERKVALAEAQHQHKVNMDTIKAGTDAAKAIADLAEKSTQQGINSANSDIQKQLAASS